MGFNSGFKGLREAEATIRHSKQPNILSKPVLDSNGFLALRSA